MARRALSALSAAASLLLVAAAPFAVTFDTDKPLGLRLSPALSVLGFARGDDGLRLAGEKSGWLRTGDVLQTVNEQNVTGLALSEVQSLIGAASRPKVLIFEAANGGNRTADMSTAFAQAQGMHGHEILLQLFWRGSPLRVPWAPLAGLQGMFGGPVGCTPPGGAGFVVASPISGCLSHQSRDAAVAGRFLVVRRGDCSFADKAVLAQNARAAGLIVINSEDDAEALRMPWDPANKQSLSLPAVMLSNADGARLLNALAGGEPSVRDDAAAAAASGKDGADRKGQSKGQRAPSPEPPRRRLSRLEADPAAGVVGPTELRGRLVLSAHWQHCPSGLNDRFNLTAARQAAIAQAATGPDSDAAAAALGRRLGDANAAGAGDAAADGDADGDAFGDPTSPSGHILVFPAVAARRVAAAEAAAAAVAVSNASAVNASVGGLVPPTLPRNDTAGYYSDATDADAATVQAAQQQLEEEEEEDDEEEQSPSREQSRSRRPRPLAGSSSWVRRLQKRYGKSGEGAPAWLEAEKVAAAAGGNGADSNSSASGSTSSSLQQQKAPVRLSLPTLLALSSSLGSSGRGEYLLAQPGLGALLVPTAPLPLRFAGAAAMCAPVGGAAAAGGSPADAHAARHKARALAEARTGCSPIDADDISTQGQPFQSSKRFALVVERGGCPFHVKVAHAAAAGASLVIVTNAGPEQALLRMAPPPKAVLQRMHEDEAKASADAISTPGSKHVRALGVAASLQRAARATPAVLVSAEAGAQLWRTVCAGDRDAASHGDATPADSVLEVALIGDGGHIASAWAALAALDAAEGDGIADSSHAADTGGDAAALPASEAVVRSIKHLQPQRWPADRKAARRLYMRLSRENHPDRDGGSQERFQWLARSYERLEQQLDDAEAAAASRTEL